VGKGKRLLRVAGLCAAGFAALLLAADGLCGVWMVGRRLGGPAANLSHTEHDPLLGWISRKHFHDPDYYGPGVSVSTNPEGWRGAGEYAPTVPAGKVRVFCLGDSFTFGHGVGDDEAWPARLAARNARLETVNMGQSGYGLDQMYLWYKRDGDRVRHNLVVVAIIEEDLGRIALDRMDGYPKPLLELTDAGLAPKDYPLPVRTLGARLRRRAVAFKDLRALSLASRLIPTLRLESAEPPPPERRHSPTYEHALVIRIVEDLERLAEARGSRLVVAYLPTLWDLRARAARDSSYRALLAGVLQARHIQFLDLTGAFQRLPPMELGSLFLDEPEAYLTSVHYSPEGHAFAARLLDAALFTGEPPGGVRP
jgi:hypothetical protein